MINIDVDIQEKMCTVSNMQQPSESIHSIETSLRMAIKEILGESWQDQLPSKGRHSKEGLLKRREEEEEKRPALKTPGDLLEYVYTPYLKEIILDNWPEFDEMFIDEKRTEVFLDYILSIRNSIAHSRGVVAFERDLISGMAGMFRGLVSEYRGKKDRTSEYYPLIEEVSDTWGDKGVKANSASTPYDFSSEGVYLTGYASKPKPRRLSVGDVITFQCHAAEVKYVSLKWLVGPCQPYFGHDQSATKFNEVGLGPDVEFNYYVTEDDVGEERFISVILTTEDKFHRHCWYDDVREFCYIVEPPRRAPRQPIGVEK